DTNEQRWHLFESYMHLCSGKTGKRWKDWLFEKAENSSDEFVTVLEKEAYVCMATTVRKYVSAEGDRKARLDGVWVKSIHELSSPNSGSDATIGDNIRGNWWENPALQAEWAELRGIAHSNAMKVFNTLDHSGKVAVLADRLDVSLADSHVIGFAGVKKSVLYDRLKKLSSVVREKLHSDYSSEDPQTVEALICFTLEAVGRACIMWGKSERAAEPLFGVYAENVFNALDLAGKVAVLADHFNIPLADPFVSSLSGLEKSDLDGRLKNLSSSVRATLHTNFSSGDSQTDDLLIAFTLKAVGEASIVWGKSEKSAEPLFILSHKRTQL
ncbi:MAG: hypothetical protein WCL08_12355, partial [Verrucomicrobiota bacterium]